MQKNCRSVEVTEINQLFEVLQCRTPFILKDGYMSHGLARVGCESLTRLRLRKGRSSAVAPGAKLYIYAKHAQIWKGSGWHSAFSDEAVHLTSA